MFVVRQQRGSPGGKLRTKAARGARGIGGEYDCESKVKISVRKLWVHSKRIAKIRLLGSRLPRVDCVQLCGRNPDNCGKSVSRSDTRFTIETRSKQETETTQRQQ